MDYLEEAAAELARPATTTRSGAETPGMIAARRCEREILAEVTPAAWR